MFEAGKAASRSEENSKSEDIVGDVQAGWCLSSWLPSHSVSDQDQLCTRIHDSAPGVLMLRCVPGQLAWSEREVAHAILALSPSLESGRLRESLTGFDPSGSSGLWRPTPAVIFFFTLAVPILQPPNPLPGESPRWDLGSFPPPADVNARGGWCGTASAARNALAQLAGSKLHERNRAALLARPRFVSLHVGTLSAQSRYIPHLSAIRAQLLI